MVEKIVLVRPRGFCAGVDRAVRTVSECLHIFGAPVYVKHQIVHNKTVVRDLESKGVITVENLSEVPEGSVVVFSAHGSSPKQYVEAKSRNLRVIDATCPLVTKVHLEAHRYLKAGYDIVYIGHRGHIEGEGVLAEAELYGKKIPLVESVADVLKLGTLSDHVVYLTQTTLNVSETQEIISALEEKFPTIEKPPLQDICYATTNRQWAVRALAKKVDGIFVVGSSNSSNSNRLVDTARDAGVEAYLVEDVEAVSKISVEHWKTAGITAGASASEKTVQSIAGFFVSRGAVCEEFESVSENLFFADPLELQKIRG